MFETMHNATEVNSHYLERVVQASKMRQIEACEDIYSHTGIKLIAKGSRISHDVQERLIIHKLRKPLESCISVQDGVEMPVLTEIAEKIYAETPSLHPLLDIASCLRSLKAIQYNKATSSLLSVQAGHDNSGLHHNVHVAMVAASLASRIGGGDNSIQAVAVAALLHDIGELYIDPQYLNQSRPLTLEEWRHVYVHPVIGHKLVRGICGINSEAADAIYEHHERGNGFGYPRGTTANEQSFAGQILAAAELIVSFIRSHDQPLARAELALRIVPGEFNFNIISTLSKAIGSKDQAAAKESKPINNEAVQSLFMQIGRVSEQLHDLEENSEARSARLVRLRERAATHFHMIQRSFSSTGLDLCLERIERETLLENASEWLTLEMELITQELRWRLNELARDLSSRMSALSEADSILFRPLIETLYSYRSPASYD